MIHSIKIFCMFAMLYISNATSHGANTTTELKKDIGGAYGCKYRVLSKHRLDVYSSDPSSFINQTPFNMLYTKGQSNGSDSNCIGEVLSLNEISKQHDLNRQSLVKRLNNRPKEELIDDSIVEMDAKNQAYYFILENGLFMQFRDYCFTK